MVVARETMSLAFLVAVQFLEARQRAVLILRDVLGWTARETADLLDTTEAAINGVLRRARAVLRTQRDALGTAIGAPARAAEEQEQELIRRYVDAAERADVDGLAALLTDDVRSSMPPQTESWVGRDDVVESWIEGGFGSPELRDFHCLITRANGMPAVACYHRAPGASEYLPLAMDVLHVRDGRIDEIVTFPFADRLDAFGLPATLGARPA
jgi:RNA polymerase sigma-70 factor (TIGR02960 family)